MALNKLPGMTILGSHGTVNKKHDGTSQGVGFFVRRSSRVILGKFVSGQDIHLTIFIYYIRIYIHNHTIGIYIYHIYVIYI